MKTYQMTIGLGVALLALTAALAQTQAPAVADGLAENPVYKKNCAKCHGKTATGRHFGGPSLSSEKAAAASADDLKNMIANGKGRMPKFASKLTAEEIDALVQQIEKLNKK